MSILKRTLRRVIRSLTLENVHLDASHCRLDAKKPWSAPLAPLQPASLLCCMTKSRTIWSIHRCGRTAGGHARNSHRVPPHIEPDIALAAFLFAKLEQMSLDPPGITRDSYGLGEERAHGLIRQTGNELGLLVNSDPAGNTFISLPVGAAPLPGWIVGSHLDLVPHGGNFDGAAGVVAGVSVIAGLLRNGVAVKRPITCAVFRAEESTWFPASYIGSRAALGLLPPGVLTLKSFGYGKVTIATYGGTWSASAASKAGREVARARGDPRLSRSSHRTRAGTR